MTRRKNSPEAEDLKITLSTSKRRPTMLSSTKSRLSAAKTGNAGKTFLQTLFFFLLVTQICFAQEKTSLIPDGLKFYEFILLILGVVLFIVLLVILIIYVIQKRAIKGLISFFILPLIMIVYPSIQKITFDNGVVTIEKATEKLKDNPNDTEAKTELNDALGNMQVENISDPQTLTKISKGYATIGDTVSALTFVEKAKLNDPKLDEANKLYKKFNKPAVRIERITNEIKTNPNDLSLRDDLDNEVNSLQGSSNLNAITYEKLTDTYAIIGDTDKVLMFADSLLSLDPSSQHAVELQRRFIKK
jgi:tetratricopeptide (TPR) repeat protein